ncbi:MAG: sigma 54-interacting transcriptional regulator [Candidatus Poribacteria bacterium]
MSTSDKPITVLLVEDNQGDARLICEMLSEFNDTPCQLKLVERLSTGLEYLDAEDIDIVLLDLSLPDSQGLETFTIVRAHAIDVPIVVLTGLNDADMAIKAVREGAQDYLVKGEIDGKQLIRTIRYSIERKIAEEAMRGNIEILLDNLSDGIIAHDNQRHIFYFNRAAEVITGYNREEVLGRDCYSVFQDGFCGGKCSFREVVPHFEHLSYSADITTKYGEQRRVEMSIVPMKDKNGRSVGCLNSFRDVTRLLELERRLGETQQFAGIIGNHPTMLNIFDLICHLAKSEAPVLIQGESGTGKELVASAIHNEGNRSDKLFVPVNCGALPAGTLESELFGHVRGAFTGAIRDKKGRFELADGGTIFLDEVSELSPEAQVKLLRVLQEGTFERVGGETTIKIDVRIISATNKDLKQEVDSGRFREDLFYRLCVVPVNLPPLREKKTDIPLLAEHFLKIAAAEARREKMLLSREALSVMMDYQWPGNVRELQNAIQYALIKCEGNIIEPSHLPDTISSQSLPNRIKKRRRKRKLEFSAVQNALRETKGNKVKAAQLLGVSRATLYRFISDTEMNAN